VRLRGGDAREGAGILVRARMRATAPPKAASVAFLLWGHARSSAITGRRRLFHCAQVRRELHRTEVARDQIISGDLVALPVVDGDVRVVVGDELLGIFEFRFKGRHLLDHHGICPACDEVRHVVPAFSCAC
jgi:hypothetical protein